MKFPTWGKNLEKLPRLPKAVALTSCRAGAKGSGEHWEVGVGSHRCTMVAENKSPLLGTTL